MEWTRGARFENADKEHNGGWSVEETSPTLPHRIQSNSTPVRIAT